MDNTEQIYRRIKAESVDIQLLPFVNSLEGVVSLPVVKDDTLVSVQIEALKTLLNKDDKTDAKINEVKKLITSLQERINTLVGANASEAIDSFNQVITFLGGVKNNDTLNALLAKINERLSTLETTKVTTLENNVSSLRDDLTSETSNRTQSISG